MQVQSLIYVWNDLKVPARLAHPLCCCFHDSESNPPCSSLAQLAMLSQPCPASHALPIMPSQPRSDSQTLPARFWQPCSASHAPLARKLSHAPPTVPPQPCSANFPALAAPKRRDRTGVRQMKDGCTRDLAWRSMYGTSIFDVLRLPYNTLNLPAPAAPNRRDRTRV